MHFILIMGPALLSRKSDSDFKRDWPFVCLFVCLDQGWGIGIFFVTAAGSSQSRAVDWLILCTQPRHYTHPCLEGPCEELAYLMKTEVPISVKRPNLKAKGRQGCSGFYTLGPAAPEGFLPGDITCRVRRWVDSNICLLGFCHELRNPVAPGTSNL